MRGMQLGRDDCLKVLALVFASVLAMMLCGQSAKAQLSTATINGTVRDASGAVIPGATIVLRNEDTSVARNSSHESSAARPRAS